MKLNDVFLIRFWRKLNKYLNGKHKFIRKNTEEKDRRKMFRYIINNMVIIKLIISQLMSKK